MLVPGPDLCTVCKQSQTYEYSVYTTASATSVTGTVFMRRISLLLGQCALSELHTFCILFFTLSCLLCILLYSSYWIFKSTWLNKQAIIGSCTFTKGQWCGSTFILFWDPFRWLGSGSFQNKVKRLLKTLKFTSKRVFMTQKFLIFVKFLTTVFFNKLIFESGSAASQKHNSVKWVSQHKFSWIFFALVYPSKPLAILTLFRGQKIIINIHCTVISTAWRWWQVVAVLVGSSPGFDSCSSDV